MTFYNVVVPGSVSQGTEAAPVSLVDIARGPNGNEQRKSKRSRRLRRFNIAKNIRTVNDVYDILQLFEVMNGPEHSFACKNLIDYKSCKPADNISMTDALIGVGDGANLNFQLKKQYKVTKVDNTVIAIDRTIVLPMVASAGIPAPLIAVDGVLKTEAVEYVINYETGAVTFVAGHAPANLKNVTAGFWFNEKVRFDTNDLSQVMEFFRVGSVPSIPLIEVR
ncbi:TIGR02217 family protein [Mesorhizobium sp. M2D.F.Ca.ET.232.01.1.1]|uniref:phage distal tail protein, Rcc01695 family n=1 Tax=Mesorhizobium sp. M2D.F.Ca.ET.232.01.1.1 TaxID=2496670 RepID=UPI000FCBED48|nr:TIGR02217 family protein [Mesorhizobium sp. M2D.F.Ca.ET.232.01.1.1]TGP28198.1 TIGR02217 family protein [Mesorhizobium sp. M2D.F.Ca.ET.232.01.1.1]